MKCVHCGLQENEHHRFEAIAVPAGCVCDSGTWGNPLKIPPACSKYTGDGDCYCDVCEHNKECHAAKPEEPSKTGGTD